MMQYNSLESIPPLKPPFALAFGFFDGVHIGHLQLIAALKKKGPSAIVAFTNHPGSLFTKKTPPPLLSSNELKKELLQNYQIDLLVTLPFTQELASLSYEEFLKLLQKKIPFTHFVRGKGDAFGKDREGTESAVKELGKKMGFEAHYLEKISSGNKIISSTLIRKYVQEGNIQEASLLLGRPFSLYLSPKEPLSTSLVLPPPGTYKGALIQNQKKKEVSFSIRNDCILSLEIGKEFDSKQPLILEFINPRLLLP